MATRRRRAAQAATQRQIERALLGGNKYQNTGNAKVDAKRHTYEDKADFKKNRAAGDKAMAKRAFDGLGDVKHGFGNDKETKRGHTLETMEKFGRKGSNVYGNGGGRGIETPQKAPNAITKRKDPENIQRQKQSQNQEMEDLKRMEAEDELKKKKGTDA